MKIFLSSKGMTRVSACDGICEVKVWRLYIAIMLSLEAGSTPCSTCNFLHVSSQYLLLCCFAIMSSSKKKKTMELT